MEHTVTDINISQWQPFSFDSLPNIKAGTKCEVKTSHGIRIATYSPPRLMCYWLALDCDHPMQNANLSTAVTHYRIFSEKNTIEDAEFELVPQKFITT